MKKKKFSNLLDETIDDYEYEVQQDMRKANDKGMEEFMSNMIPKEDNIDIFDEFEKVEKDKHMKCIKEIVVLAKISFEEIMIMMNELNDGQRTVLMHIYKVLQKNKRNLKLLISG
ncbi:hypothetical protein QAD02_017598 [Eretmocerus hayati]|uniref:Uncharacterized protein n=1 Tax=Eretmocerus hayati TaxID=131215 RepID=A0ACC2PG61_9HYME|nr:hypothetical protein QAD02_017598 [Eretmocerus hayati]